MSDNQIVSEAKSIQKITYIGMFTNIVLAIIKLIAGTLTGSLALVADGIHSFSDLVTDFVVIVGAFLAGRPADHDHPFGHGKFETVGVVLIGVILCLIGGGIGWEGYKSLISGRTSPPGLWIIIVALISLAAKEILYHLTIQIARKCRSAALRANAWHHRSDALSSLVVLGGGVGSLFGWHRADSLAGIVVGVMVAIVGIKLGLDAIAELTETSAGSDVEKEIETVLYGFDEVRGWHRLRIRRLGRELEMDVHILLNSQLTIKEGHEIVKKIEHAIEDNLNWPVKHTIHIDPDSPEIRNASRKREKYVLK